MAHQNSQFAVRAPVAARSRLGAARRYRLRSPLGVARLIPENPDSALGCHVLADDTLRKVIGKCRGKPSTGESASKET